MHNEKDAQVISVLLEKGIIPAENTFEIDQTMVDEFYGVYHNLFGKSNKENTKGNKTFAKKLAGLSLLKLNKQRISLNKTLSITRISDTHSGFCYFVSNPKFVGYSKVGMTKDVNKRLRQYQTGDPLREYKIDNYVLCKNARLVEKTILEKYKIDVSVGEWIEQYDKKELLTFVKNLSNVIS